MEKVLKNMLEELLERSELNPGLSEILSVSKDYGRLAAALVAKRAVGDGVLCWINHPEYVNENSLTYKNGGFFISWRGQEYKLGDHELEGIDKKLLIEFIKSEA